MNKKVIFLITDLSMGGGQRVVSELSLNFPDCIETTIVLFKNKVSYPYKGKLISLDLPISHNFLLRIYCFFLGIYRFKKIIKREKPAYVISFGIPANVVNVLSHKKTLIRADGFMLKSKNLGYRILAKLFFKKSEKFICVSKTMANDLIKNFRIKKEKIKIIYNPIDIEKIYSLIQEPIESKRYEIFKNPVIINAGRFSEEKNQAHLIRTFKQVRDKIREAKLVILGEGETEPYLRELVKDLNLENSVYFLGWQDNPFKFLARAKVYVLPSLMERLPYGILEAMACGLPIVSVDCKSGPREILAPNSDMNQEAKDIEFVDYGILCPIKNENKLAEAIIQVLNNKQLSNNLVEKSKQRAEDFNVKKIIKKWDFLTY